MYSENAPTFEQYDENSMTSGNAYSGRNLKRMKLSFKDTEILFAVNPEDYTQSEPNKATITHTKGGAWIDAWGAGIIELTIKGTTGVRGGTNNIDTGYQRWKELRNLFRDVYESVTDGEEISELIRFYNFTDNEYFYCYPSQNGIELYRSKSRPHIYQYSINLWAVRRIGQPQYSSGVIGNPNKKHEDNSVNGGSKTTKSTTVSISGGGKFQTRNTSLTDNKDRVTVTNTKTKSNADIQFDCGLYLKKLEPIIGGKNGKISPVTGFKCAQGLLVQSSGTVSNVPSFSGLDLSEDVDFLLREVKFTSRVSTETYSMLKKIRDYSPEVLSPLYSIIPGLTPKQKVIQSISSSTSYDSIIFEMMLNYQPKSILSKNEVNRLKLILLECMMIYLELNRLYNSEDELHTTLTISGINTLLTNIRSTIMYFTFKSVNDDAKYQRMNISAELRELEKIITQVKIDVVEYL